MKMIPAPEGFGRVNSVAELRVAQLLAQANLGVLTACLYSLRLPEHEYKRMSEMDFVIVWDDTVLVVEVKGGRVSRREGLWTFTDRYGKTHEKREGPFEQASSAMFALERRLLNRLPHLDVAFGFLVLTPDQELDPDMEWAPQQHGGPRTMSVRGVEQALRRARNFAHERLGHPVRGGARSELLSVLRPDFDRVPNLAARAAGLEREYVRLAERQYDLLLGAESNDRIVCTGGAGSGKTLLAVETARRAAASGRNVVLTCRSPHLAGVLRDSVVGTGVVCGALSELRGTAPGDVLVVDEAQDLMDVDAVLRLDVLVQGGWTAGSWRVFCDPNNQANVDGSFDKQTFDELAAGAVSISLPYNCRNTSPIVLQTQLITGADVGVARAGAGPAVDYKRYRDDDEEAGLLDAQLTELRQQDVDLADVAVVTLRDRTEESSALRTKAFRAGRLKNVVDPGKGRSGVARLVTTPQIKGLEVAHVCIVDVDGIADPVRAARLYVAMTRPRISLWLAVSETAWRQIEQGGERTKP
ncbi:NERD domain-containing protein [Amycolatopsis sp. NPDC048633]|uniref:nuclease-related domain-containing DEAD/DEAH box helicase n=1 Tax=Amycolatopsis sp. NPDC048633 TaxID=3157095 RepID=UPI0033C9A1A7